MKTKKKITLFLWKYFTQPITLNKNLYPSEPLMGFDQRLNGTVFNSSKGISNNKTMVVCWKKRLYQCFIFLAMSCH